MAVVGESSSSSLGIDRKKGKQKISHHDQCTILDLIPYYCTPNDMVWDIAMTMNLVTSVMMNGVCCINSPEEEEQRQKEQREEFRKSVNVEWQRLKLMEFEEQRRIMEYNGLDRASILAEERRRSLIATKAMASQQSSVASLAGSRASVASDYSQRSYPKEIFHNSAFFPQRLEEEDYDHQISRRQDKKNTPKYNFVGTEKIKRRINIRTRSRSIDSKTRKHKDSRPIPLIVGGPGSVNRSDSSLLDQDSSDSEEFDEIQLV